MTPKTIQQKQLISLLQTASQTEIGKKYRFADIQSYAEFARRLPLQTYDDISTYVERLKQGATDLLWPGEIDKFSVSAGTTSSGKHLPISTERLKADQRFIRKVATSYFRQRFSISPLLGKHLSIPGTLQKKQMNHREIELGEISGFLGALTPWYLTGNQLIRPERLLSLPFSEKFDRLVNASLKADIRVITAVPSWTLTLFQEVLKKTGHAKIDQIWPNLQLIISGGVKLTHYQSHLESLCGSVSPDFIETYGASEGYFSFTDDVRDANMRLMLANGIFYEWIPYEESSQTLKTNQAVSTRNVETDQLYAMVVTTNSGLWRYQVEDVIKFTQLSPPKIKVKGRTQEVLDTFGEAVYGWEAESALIACAEDHNFSFDQFTVGSLLRDEDEIPRHYWFVIFEEPDTIEQSVLRKLSRAIDQHLQSVNRHYAIRRESDALGIPVVFKINFSIMKDWLEYKGKLQVQGKLPRILLDKNEIRMMLKLIEN